MAASGINEHHEALRKQKFVNRRIFLQKQFLDKLKNNPEEVRLNLERNTFADAQETLANSNSLELEKLQRKLKTAGSEEEKQVIKKHIDYLTYSAKIKGRFNSTNYKQQW